MKRNILAMGIALALFGCNSEKKMESADTINLTESVQPSTPDNSLSKVIKTADIKFKVRDVQKTKSQISTILNAIGGSVSEFSIESTVKKTDHIQYTRDSLKEVTVYRTDGLLIAKVPAEKLDDFTNLVFGMAVFTEQASLKADDQTATYMTNLLKGKTRSDAAKELTGVDSAKLASIDRKITLKDEAVDRKLDNWVINSKSKFSTVTLNFYEDNSVKTTWIANDNLQDYKPPFFSRLRLNLLGGWNFFEEILLLLSNLWVLIGLGFLIFFGLKYFRIKRI